MQTGEAQDCPRWLSEIYEQPCDIETCYAYCRGVEGAYSGGCGTFNSELEYVCVCGNEC